MTKLEHLIALSFLQREEKEYNGFISEDITNVVTPKRIDRWIYRDMARSLNKEKTRKAKRIISRIIIAAMLVMSLLFVSLMCFATTRDAIFKAIIEWHDNYIAIRYNTEDNEEEITETGNTEVPTGEEQPTEETSATPTTPTYIEKEVRPTYSPEGVIEIPIISNQTLVTTEYYNAEGDLIYIFDQHVITEESKNYDNEGATVKEVSKEGFTGTIVTFAGVEDKYLIWRDTEYLYVITAYLITEEEMISIAKSVNSSKK